MSQNPATQQHFTIIIEHDLESGWLVGSVAELPGCYTQAPDMASLEASIGEAIQVYLATVGEEECPMIALIFMPSGC